MLGPGVSQPVPHVCPVLDSNPCGQTWQNSHTAPLTHGVTHRVGWERKTPEQPPGEAGTAELGATTRDVKVRAVQPTVFPLTLAVSPVQRMSGFEEPTVDHCGPSQMVAQCSGYSGCMFSMSSSVWWYAVIRLVDAFPSVPVGKDHEKQFVSRQGW